ncbi:MAG: ATP-binding protein [Sneathiella sp.]
MLAELIKSIALLLVISLLQNFIDRRWQENQLLGKITSGLLFAVICIVSMTPHLNAHSNIILDAHSAVLVVATLSGGLIVGLIAAVSSGLFSLWNEGGLTFEIGIIATSLFMGLAFRYGAERGWLAKNIFHYLTLGILVQIITLIWLFYETRRRGEFIELDIALTLLIAYALSTAVLGWMLDDIKRRLATEKALRASEQRSRAIFDQTFEFIGLLTLDGKLIECNRASLSYAGINIASVIGMPFWETPWWSHSITARHQLKKAISRAALGELVRFETTNTGPDGSFIYVDFSVKPTFDDEGEVDYLVCEGRDISIRKNLAAQLHHSQRMEAVGHMAGSISHHFNNLFTVISGHAEALKTVVSKDKKSEQHLTTIIRTIDRAANFTHRLVSFSRMQTLKPAVTNLNAEIASTEEKMGWALGNNIHLETSLSESLWPASLDRQQFSKALCSLAQNAKDAMPEGGKIIIRTANFTADEAYSRHHLEGPEPGEYVMVSVTDTGAGMSQQVQEKAFDPFYTTKEGGAGDGLGLSMAYGFIKQSRGYITLESEVGNGTLVRLYVPRFLNEPAAKVEILDKIEA